MAGAWPGPWPERSSARTCSFSRRRVDPGPCDPTVLTTHTPFHAHEWNLVLTPKVLEATFQAFLKFGQAIVDAMFVQKISNFWWTCGLVLASRCTNFYKIPIFGLGVMPQKQNSFLKNLAFLGWIVFIDS
jgi:hypothetical protein